jgi:hypothetical protein
MVTWGGNPLIRPETAFPTKSFGQNGFEAILYLSILFKFNISDCHTRANCSWFLIKWFFPAM